ncbi:MAG: ferritin-like domain-containing protein [Scytonema sp. PMC 1069.18]|nr:ferritin-like domain-containing protein [Scytonema sp. PMC 1069.18]MEC4883592.1 ferritin-like domain-containing protein [Scytonema sp. PMC 1070.18]
MTNYKIAGFDLPNLSQEDTLCRVLSSALNSRLGKQKEERENVLLFSYWDVNYFSLDRVKIFLHSTPEEQAEILHLCNCGLLEEAYFIEKAGVGYMAKMVALAETTEERMLYALFSADEATHLAQINRFLPYNKLVETDNPFLRLLEDVVESQDKAVLLFVLQVVLEGWGLSHYRNLAKQCQNSNLSSVLSVFLQDESRHHGTGVKLFDRMTLAKSSQETIIQTLTLFLQMVQVGPQSVVAAIEKVKGYLSRSQKVQIFQELDTENHSGSRLLTLRSLMRNPHAGVIVEELETRGAFQPFPVEKCIFSY